MLPLCRFVPLYEIACEQLVVQATSSFLKSLHFAICFPDTRLQHNTTSKTNTTQYKMRSGLQITSMVLLALTSTSVSVCPTTSHGAAEGLDAKISGKPMLRSLGSVYGPSRSLGFFKSCWNFITCRTCQETTNASLDRAPSIHLNIKNPLKK
ncbi:unnamed protein product [Albugo candida]|uniref:Uncharacterized protein n=1 Tax=Albugo candida TaxID=65357 RepID=A0A024FVP6_9STRA|nr:unnamed protein product [Albugo candida]|eukprot:CCI11096.1 unnamed protein product [Albugo candida]